MTPSVPGEPVATTPPGTPEGRRGRALPPPQAHLTPGGSGPGKTTLRATAGPRGTHLSTRRAASGGSSAAPTAASDLTGAGAPEP